MKAKISMVAAGVLIGLLGAGRPCLAKPESITLPPETAALKEAVEPGYEMTTYTCVVCHSVDYIETQPPGKGEDFWTAEVAKMIKVYGAVVDEADRQAIIDYLFNNY